MAAGASFIQHRRDAVECYICGCTDRLLDHGEFAARNRRHLRPDILRNVSTRNRRAKYLRFGDQ
jgi:hypothetical protein